MAKKWIGGTIAAIFCMTSVLGGLEAFAKEWSQNLDAKPIILPCGLKFGEVYEGTVKQVRTNYLNGIASRCYEAVMTNSWCGFDEITIMLTGKKRIEGVRGIREDGRCFDEAVSNLVMRKESLARKYGIRFMGDATPQTIGKMRSWSITGAGANDETVFLRVAEGRSEGEKGVKTFSSMAIHSRIAAKLELKDLDAEAADLSAAIKSVFGVDLEAPQSKPLWGFSWEKLPTPIEGLTSLTAMFRVPSLRRRLGELWLHWKRRMERSCPTAVGICCRVKKAMAFQLPTTLSIEGKISILWRMVQLARSSCPLNMPSRAMLCATGNTNSCSRAESCSRRRERAGFLRRRTLHAGLRGTGILFFGRFHRAGHNVRSAGRRGLRSHCKVPRAQRPGNEAN